MHRKIRLVNKKRFILANLCLFSFIAFAVITVRYFSVGMSAMKKVANETGYEPVNQSTAIKANYGDGAALYPGNTIVFSVEQSWEENGEAKQSEVAGAKVQMTPSDPIIGEVDADNSQFIITEPVSEMKEFSIDVSYAGKTQTYSYKVFPQK